ncbi:short-chain dehydrogenase/reductase SDR [Magnetococcus marinus MC-1]|uniref:Short-chain dehydrogenase/reductase SDR n=1 Tax=Magnetococcus marinus (strain ATCC BAA-1437 / JCM 17883 / MC-1) TaxID=156889 RepID=A0L4G1_MAGMM|nr:SDR family oxidoreductase [Magnetococcus marinus]ABK42854.1 short-chain dehydrogenase/reductase SDR [Magnetococcus marinus MC-1]
MDTTGCRALVTGAGRRIGAAIALALGEAGMDVAVHYSGSAQGAEQSCAALAKMGRRACAFQADLSDWAQAEALLPRVVAQMGPVRVLVNSAAIFERSDLVDQSQAQWRRHMAINLEAPMLLMQHFARQWQSDQPPDGAGRIVNILDRRVLAPPPGHLAYNAAKGALWSLTRVAARELAPHITVNGVGPGPILPAAGEPLEQFAKVIAATPMQRSGTPQEVADAVLYFIQNGFVTGQMICIDGGEHLL